MTTGTITTDQRSYFSGSCGSGNIVGFYSTKTWSGGDYPKTKPPRGSVTSYFKPGTRTLDKVRREWTRPPKRARSEVHGYDMSYNRFYDEPLTYHYGQPWDPYYQGTYISCFSGVVYESAWDSNADIELLSKLREQVAGSSFNPAIFLGEGKEALNLITNSAIRIAAAIRLARKGNLSGAGEQLAGSSRKPIRHRAGQGWLGTQYGVLPLLQDAEDGAKFLAHQFSAPLQFKKKVTVRKQGTVRCATTYFTFGSGHGFRRKSITATLTEADTVALTGLYNPEQVAWELTPWSFVVDWFLPIGDFLAARALTQAIKGTFVTSDIEKVQASNPFVNDSAPFGFSCSTPAFWQEFGTFKRSISTSLDVPLPSVVPLGKAISWKRAVNAVALLSGLVK